MATSEERAFEDAIIAALEALPYITANSVPVRNWDDQATTRALPCVAVRVAPRERIAPNADFYRFGVEIGCYRHRGEDENQAVQDQIYNEVADWANDIDALADFSADGITYNPGNEDVDDKIHLRGVSFDLYDTIT